MADELYGLSESDVDVLRELVRAYRSGQLGRPVQNRRSALPERTNVLVAKTQGSGIAAISSDTPGSATVDVYKIDTDGDLAATGDTVTAYNLASTAVSASVYIQIKREAASGFWLVDFEDCG